MTDGTETEDDATLLRAYCAGHSEEAFRKLVERHLPAVWNAARRLVNGDGALAEDVTQEVFTHLAQRARTLPARVALGGWLHRHACFTAAKTVRTAVRRRARELDAATAMNAPASDPWPEMAPHLDAALQSLPFAERNALMLRFFENRDFRSIGLALGTSEDGARMKTSRAVEKLRSRLGRRGVVLTAAVLASLLGERTMAAPPPAGMAAQVSSSALTNAGRATTGAMAALWMSLMRRKAAVAAGLVAVAAGTTLWYWNTLFDGGKKQPPALQAQSARPNKATPATGSVPAGAITVHLILVPEAEAFALLNDRWSGDHDKAILDGLLKRAGNDPDGITVAQTLTGECVGGQRIKKQKADDISYSTGFKMDDEGAITPNEPGSRLAGSIMEAELNIGEDRKSCDLNLAIEHHFEKPAAQPWSPGLENTATASSPEIMLTTFSPAKLAAQILMEDGGSRLVASTQLPPPDGSPAGTSSRYLMTFVTINIVLPP